MKRLLGCVRIFATGVLLAASFPMAEPRRLWISRVAAVGIVLAAVVIMTKPFRPSVVPNAVAMRLMDEVGPSAKNNHSPVVRLRYGDRSILLPDDAEKRTVYERCTGSEPTGLHADVLETATTESRILAARVSGP